MSVSQDCDGAGTDAVGVSQVADGSAFDQAVGDVLVQDWIQFAAYTGVRLFYDWRRIHRGVVGRLPGVADIGPVGYFAGCIY